VPESPLVVVGGASFPLGEAMNVSAPLAQATADDDGVHIGLRVNAHPLRFWWFRLILNETERAKTCSFAWRELKSVDRARRAMILYGVDGRSCRFASKRARNLDLLTERIAAHGVPVRPVQWTVGWYFSRQRT